MEKVGVVICNYNKAKDVIVCIRSVLESKNQDFHIYVVDNASSDDSVQRIRKEYGDNRKVTLICNNENLGGSGGFNTGLRIAEEQGYPYLMCIDNDAFLDENCLGELISFMEKTPEAGIAAAKIYRAENQGYIQQYGSYIDWNDYCVNSPYYNYPEDNTLPEVIYSDAVPACAMMIRRSVIKEIGFMPEENFLYWDDTEWCYRCHLAGYKVASVGSALACHAMGAKKEDVTTFPTYYAWRNRIYFFMKFLPENKIGDMADSFLNGIFEIQYEGLYRDEPERARTVMAALDDVIHGKMGKADEECIFPVVQRDHRLEQILAGKQRLCIIDAGYKEEAECLRMRIMSEQSGKQIAVVNDIADCDVSITLCKSIFQINDFSMMTYYMDIDDNILASEEDSLMIINYNYSKRLFLYAEKPLFLRLINKGIGGTV